MKHGLHKSPKAIIFFVAMCLLISCNKTSKTPKEEGRYFLISHAGAGDPFWNIEFNGAKKAALELGINLQIVAPETPNDIARQVELLNAAIATKPKGIALSVPDDNAFSPSLQEARKKGIPVIAFNTRPNEAALKNNPFLAYVGMDDYEAGNKLAKKVLDTKTVKNGVVVAIHQAGHVGLENRYAGIRDACEKQSISVHKLDISSDATQSQQIIQGYLTKNKQTSVVFLLGAFGAQAVGRMLREEFPEVLLVSFDLSPLILELVANQTLAFVVDQQPFMQGHIAVTELALTARYQMLPSDIHIQAEIIDKDNAQALQELVRRGVR